MYGMIVSGYEMCGLNGIHCVVCVCDI